MSKGPGRIECALAAIFDGEPDNAFTTEELCEKAYPGCYIEKKHRVSVIRAVSQLAKRRDTLIQWRSETLGRVNVYFNEDNVMSYAMARLKTDNLCHYRSNDPRIYRMMTEADLIAELSQGGSYRKYVEPGGAWWQYVQWLKEEREARRAGDMQKLKQLEAEHRMKQDQIMASIMPGGLP